MENNPGWGGTSHQYLFSSIQTFPLRMPFHSHQKKDTVTAVHSIKDLVDKCACHE